jgi:hypothetical protein
VLLGLTIFHATESAFALFALVMECCPRRSAVQVSPGQGVTALGAALVGSQVG